MRVSVPYRGVRAVALSVAPLALTLLALFTHGLRRGLHSSAASRLKHASGLRNDRSLRNLFWDILVTCDTGKACGSSDLTLSGAS
jgi:hypothetical protein